MTTPSNECASRPRTLSSPPPSYSRVIYPQCPPPASHLVLVAEAEVVLGKVAHDACRRAHKAAVLGRALKVAAALHAVGGEAKGGWIPSVSPPPPPPSDLPSFLPKGSSSCTPIQKPGLKSALPAEKRFKGCAADSLYPPPPSYRRSGRCRAACRSGPRPRSWRRGVGVRGREGRCPPAAQTGRRR